MLLEGWFGPDFVEESCMIQPQAVSQLLRRDQPIIEFNTISIRGATNMYGGHSQKSAGFEYRISTHHNGCCPSPSLLVAHYSMDLHCECLHKNQS